MIARVLQRLGKWWVSWLRATPKLWREPWPAPRPSTRGLDIPLLPSPLARRAARLFLAAQLLYAAELALTRHWFAASAIAVLAICFWWRVHVLRHPHERARRLVVTADGRLCLLTASGAVHVVWLHPASLWLGPWLLLQVRGARLRSVLLLGPDNLESGPLAAVRRRLQSPVSAGQPE